MTSSLAGVVNQPDITSLVVRSWIDIAWKNRMSTLVFAVDIQHILAVVQEFQARGVDARAVHSAMPQSEREQVLTAFRRREFPVLVNCGLYILLTVAILTEGADIPHIDCVLLLRPTKSRNLYAQMLGRGMRLAPNKQDCLIMDVVGNTQNELVCSPTLYGLEERVDFLVDSDRPSELPLLPNGGSSVTSSRSKSFLDAPTDVGFVDIDDPRELQRAMSANAAASLEKRTSFAWVDCGSNLYILGSWDGAYLKLNKEGTQWMGYYITRNPGFWKDYAAGLPTSSPYFKRKVLASEDFMHAMHAAETFVTKLCQSHQRSPKWFWRSARWRAMPATARSRALLQRSLSQGGSTEAVVPAGITQGAVQRALIRLKHGGKANWKRAMKRRNKAQSRVQAQTVQVGPL